MNRRIPTYLLLVSVALFSLLTGLALLRPSRQVLAADTDPALERTRAQAQMLDDLFKVAVVDINNRYDGPPAAKVAKTIFAAAKEKKYFEAKLLDVTGRSSERGERPPG